MDQVFEIIYYLQKKIDCYAGRIKVKNIKGKKVKGIKG